MGKTNIYSMVYMHSNFQFAARRCRPLRGLRLKKQKELAAQVGSSHRSTNDFSVQYLFQHITPSKVLHNLASWQRSFRKKIGMCVNAVVDPGFG